MTDYRAVFGYNLDYGEFALDIKAERDNVANLVAERLAKMLGATFYYLESKENV